MSKQFLVAIIVILTAFGLYMTAINFANRINDGIICERPAVVPELREEFYFAAGTPISRSVMVQ